MGQDPWLYRDIIWMYANLDLTVMQLSYTHYCNYTQISSAIQIINDGVHTHTRAYIYIYIYI